MTNGLKANTLFTSQTTDWISAAADRLMTALATAKCLFQNTNYWVFVFNEQEHHLRNASQNKGQ